MTEAKPNRRTYTCKKILRAAHWRHEVYLRKHTIRIYRKNICIFSVVKHTEREAFNAAADFVEQMKEQSDD